MKYFTFLLLLSQSVCYSQNLVPNGGFEEHTACPETLANLDGFCNSWYSYSGTCDYFNACSSGLLGYSNVLGYQVPHGGQAYSAFIAYRRYDPNRREHLGCELTEPMQIGETYYVSFYLNNCFEPQATNVACNMLGFRLMTHSYSFPDGDIPLLNNATYSSPDIISDTLGWTHFQTTILADSAYTNVIFGNFFDDPHTDTLNHPFNLNSLNQNAMYYIDDVCISKYAGFCDNWTGLFSSSDDDVSVNIYPNPTFQKIRIISHRSFSDFEIYNSLGSIVISGNFKDYPSSEIDLSDFNSGVYFIKLISRENYLIHRIIRQ
jgi:Secretion system C-terminal sorting domain